MIITAVKNDRIKYLRSLRQKKYRRSEGKCLIEGARLVRDCAANGVEIEILVLREDAVPFFDIPAGETLTVSENVFASLSETESPEGVLACVKSTVYRQGMPKSDIILILDNIQDPGNLGTIIRTANAVGVREIILSPGCAETDNPKTIRSTMGALFFEDFYAMPADEACRRLKQEGYLICAAALSGQSCYKSGVENRIKGRKVALVIGNEGNGISDEALKEADEILTLPMEGKAESLNAAVCAGILLYDIKYRMKGN